MIQDDKAVERTFLTRLSNGTVTVWSDRPSDEGLYRVRIIASQEDGYGVLLTDYTEFMLDV